MQEHVSAPSPERRRSREDLDDLLDEIDIAESVTDQQLLARAQLLILGRRDTDLFVYLQPQDLKQRALAAYVASKRICQANRERLMRLLAQSGILCDEDVLN